MLPFFLRENSYLAIDNILNHLDQVYMNLSFRTFWATKLILLISISSFAQIKYQKTIKEALQKAAAEDKPVFVHAGMSARLMGMPVKTVSDQPEIADFYNKNFVNYLIPSDSPEFADYRARYQISSYPILFFLNAEEELIYKSPKPASTSKEFITYGQQALDRLKSGNSLFAYANKYKSGTIGKSQLKEYIKLRIEAGLYDNSQLLDQYIDSLTVGDLNDYQEVLFIFQAAPIAFGKAYRVAFTNQKVVDSIYKTEPVNERVEMNNRIISNTFNTAVAEKDRTMLNNLRTFILNINRPNYKEGNEQVALKSLAFYKAVADTAQYFTTALHYYDQYYMRQNTDSLRTLALKNQQARDEMKANIERMNARAKKKPKRNAADSAAVRVVTTRTVTIAGTNSRVASTLNSIAWDFYTMGTRNMNYLTKALQWSIRSIEIDPDPAYYDTLAHLFYRMGLVDEAVLNQNKAIALLMNLPAQKQQLEDAKAEATKMRERRL